MLTVDLIKTSQFYYHNAIKNNAENVEAMRSPILAIPYITSNDEHQQNQYCPDDSWCSFWNAKLQPSRPDLPNAMLKVILPMYERLSETKLIERCARVAPKVQMNARMVRSGDGAWRPNGLEREQHWLVLRWRLWHSKVDCALEFKRAFGLHLGTLAQSEVKDWRKINRKCQQLKKSL